MKKIISIVVIISFFSTQVLASPSSSNPASERFDKARLFSQNLEIPQEFGTITRRVEGAGPLVIHIQDAHANYTAQIHIKKILEWLSRRYDIRLVGLEGASGALEPERFRLFREADINSRVIDSLVREGELTGPEFFAIENSGKKQPAFVGLEDPALYRRNLELFQAVSEYLDSSGDFLNRLKEEIARLKAKYFLPGLRRFDASREAFSEGKDGLFRYIREIARTARSVLHLDLADPKEQRDYPNLVRIAILTGSKSKNPDPIAMKQDRTRLMDVLKKSGSLEDPALSAILGILELMGNGRWNLNLSPRRFFEALYGVLVKRNIHLDDFPAFREYAKFLILESEVQASLLFEEISRLESKIYGALALGREEKQVLALSGDLRLLEKLLRLEISREEYAKAKGLSLSKLTARISSFGGPSARAVRPPSNVDALFGKALEFYDLAIKREEALAGKLLTESRKKKAEAVALVTGGFHAEGIQKILSQKGVASVSIVPKADGTSSTETYRRVMLNQGLESTLGTPLKIARAESYAFANPRDPGRPQKIMQRGLMRGNRLLALETQKEMQGNALGKEKELSNESILLGDLKILSLRFAAGSLMFLMLSGFIFCAYLIILILLHIGATEKNELDRGEFYFCSFPIVFAVFLRLSIPILGTVMHSAETIGDKADRKGQWQKIKKVVFKKFRFQNSEEQSKHVIELNDFWENHGDPIATRLLEMTNTKEELEEIFKHLATLENQLAEQGKNLGRVFSDSKSLLATILRRAKAIDQLFASLNLAIFLIKIGVDPAVAFQDQTPYLTTISVTEAEFDASAIDLVPLVDRLRRMGIPNVFLDSTVWKVISTARTKEEATQFLTAIEALAIKLKSQASDLFSNNIWITIVDNKISSLKKSEEDLIIDMDCLGILLLSKGFPREANWGQIPWQLLLDEVKIYVMKNTDFEIEFIPQETRDESEYDYNNVDWQLGMPALITNTVIVRRQSIRLKPVKSGEANPPISAQSLGEDDVRGNTLGCVIPAAVFSGIFFLMGYFSNPKDVLGRPDESRIPEMIFGGSVFVISILVILTILAAILIKYLWRPGSQMNKRYLIREFEFRNRTQKKEVLKMLDILGEKLEKIKIGLLIPTFRDALPEIIKGAQSYDKLVMDLKLLGMLVTHKSFPKSDVHWNQVRWADLLDQLKSIVEKGGDFEIEFISEISHDTEAIEPFWTSGYSDPHGTPSEHIIDRQQSIRVIPVNKLGERPSNSAQSLGVPSKKEMLFFGGLGALIFGVTFLSEYFNFVGHYQSGLGTPARQRDNNLNISSFMFAVSMFFFLLGLFKTFPRPAGWLHKRRLIRELNPQNETQKREILEIIDILIKKLREEDIDREVVDWPGSIKKIQQIRNQGNGFEIKYYPGTSHEEAVVGADGITPEKYDLVVDSSPSFEIVPVPSRNAPLTKDPENREKDETPSKGHSPGGEFSEAALDQVGSNLEQLAKDPDAHVVRDQIPQILARIRGKEIKLKGESIDVIKVTPDGEKIIGPIDRNIAHEYGLLHRTANAFIVTPEGKLLIQRRVHNKAEALKLSIYGGHVPSGSTYADTIIKEIAEELGLPDDWKLQGKFPPSPRGEGAFTSPAWDQKNRERRSLYVYFATQEELEKVLEHADLIKDRKRERTEDEFRGWIEDEQKKKSGMGEVWAIYQFSLNELVPMASDAAEPVNLTDEFKTGPVKTQAQLTSDLLEPLLKDEEVLMWLKNILGKGEAASLGQRTEREIHGVIRKITARVIGQEEPALFNRLYAELFPERPVQVHRAIAAQGRSLGLFGALFGAEKPRLGVAVMTDSAASPAGVVAKLLANPANAAVMVQDQPNANMDVYRKLIDESDLPEDVKADLNHRLVLAKPLSYDPVSIRKFLANILSGSRFLSEDGRMLTLAKLVEGIKGTLDVRKPLGLLAARTVVLASQKLLPDASRIPGIELIARDESEFKTPGSFNEYRLLASAVALKIASAGKVEELPLEIRSLLVRRGMGLYGLRNDLEHIARGLWEEFSKSRLVLSSA